MQCEALKHAPLTSSGALLRLRLVTASRQGIVKKKGGGKGALLLRRARSCKQTVIQASSHLTKE